MDDRFKEPNALRAAPRVKGATSMRARVWAQLFDDGSSTPPASTRADQRVPEDTPIPARIGRFEVLGHLGSGGMGAVYLARDPALGREVALKVVRDHSSSPEELVEAESRLRREAHAMARLRHPGVVTIHEVGVVEGRIYIAMERVDGIPLRRWLEQAPRSWRALVRVFIAAGEGLAAAHEAGVVHHDFKLDNVLVDRAGRVSVADFGLAHIGRQLERTRRDDARAGERGLLETRPGAVMGTPAYMAPEQLMGGRGDPRSDQFSFCVALYRALFGQLPFLGEHASVYTRSVLAGELRPTPRARGLRRRLLVIVRRGLAHEPSARWPSMRALVSALEAAAAPRGPRIALAGLSALAVVGALVATGSLLAAQEFERCVNTDPVGSVWDESVNDALFKLRGDALSPQEWTSVSDALNAQRTRWREHTRSLCSTDRDWTRRFESRAATRCAEQGTSLLGAFVDALREDESALASASVAVADLPPPELVCASETIHDHALQPTIDRARVMIAFGRVDAARELLRPALTRAAARGDARGEAMVSYELGRVYERSREYEAAARSLARSVELAGPRQRLLARSYLAYVESKRPDRAIVARAHLDEARRQLDALLDGGHKVLRARCANNLALASRHLGESDTARALELQALTLLRDALGDSSLEYASALLNSGLASKNRASRSKGDEGRRELRRAKQLLRDADAAFARIDAEHPKRSKTQLGLGSVLSMLKQHEAAEESFRAALASYERLYGANSHHLITPLWNLGKQLVLHTDAERAIVPLQRGIRIASSAPSPDSRELLDFRFALATAYQKTGRRPLACEEYQRALELERAPGVSAKQISNVRAQHIKHCSPPDDPTVSESATLRYASPVAASGSPSQ